MTVLKTYLHNWVCGYVKASGTLFPCAESYSDVNL